LLKHLEMETLDASAPAFSMVDGCGTSAMAAAPVPEFCACGAATCHAGRVVGESTLASRALHTLAPSHLPRALTHAAASWPAVPPASADASGLICDWMFMSPDWILGPKPAGSLGMGASGMPAGARWLICLVAGLWFVNGFFGRHAEAVARLNCRPSAMVIHTVAHPQWSFTRIRVFIYCRGFAILESKE